MSSVLNYIGSEKIKNVAFSVGLRASIQFEAIRNE